METFVTASGQLANLRRAENRKDFMASNEKVQCLAGEGCDCEEKRNYRELKEIFCKKEQWHCFGVFNGKFPW